MSNQAAASNGHQTYHLSDELSAATVVASAPSLPGSTNGHATGVETLVRGLDHVQNLSHQNDELDTRRVNQDRSPGYQQGNTTRYGAFGNLTHDPFSWCQDPATPGATPQRGARVFPGGISFQHPYNQGNMYVFSQPQSYQHPTLQPGWAYAGSQGHGNILVALPYQQAYQPVTISPQWVPPQPPSYPEALSASTELDRPLLEPIRRREPVIPDYLPLSIFVLCFCCFPIGICAVFGSVQTRDLVRQGRREEASAKSRATLHLIIYGIIWGIVGITGLALAIIYIV